MRNEPSPDPAVRELQGLVEVINDSNQQLAKRLLELEGVVEKCASIGELEAGIGVEAPKEGNIFGTPGEPHEYWCNWRIVRNVWHDKDKGWRVGYSPVVGASNYTVGMVDFMRWMKECRAVRLKVVAA